MVKRVVSLLGVFIILLTFGCNKVNNAFDADISKKDQIKSNIKCSIAIAKTRIVKGEAVPVNIKVKNISGKKVNLRLIPTFQLGNLWAPVDFKAGKRLLADTKMNLDLENDEEINSRIDIVKLGWDQTGSSIWPAKNLYSMVSSGKFKLFLDVYVDNGNFSLRSNQIEVVLLNKKYSSS